MTTKKIAPGFYTMEYKNRNIEIHNTEDGKFWYFFKVTKNDTTRAEDWYGTKKEAVQAAVDCINENLI
jgi:hypothetical protein